MSKTKVKPPKGFAVAKKTGDLIPVAQGQHCTSKGCTITFNHTGLWCGFKQVRACGCRYCYGG